MKAGIFQNRIREIRRAQKKTLADVAEAAGVSAVYISDIERGNRHGSADALERIAKALEVDVTELGVA